MCICWDLGLNYIIYKKMGKFILKNIWVLGLWHGSVCGKAYIFDGGEGLIYRKDGREESRQRPVRSWGSQFKQLCNKPDSPCDQLWERDLTPFFVLHVLAHVNETNLFSVIEKRTCGDKRITPMVLAGGVRPVCLWGERNGEGWQTANPYAWAVCG